MPLLMLPGMDGTGELLAGLAESLARERPTQVVAYPPDRQMGYAALADFVVAKAPPGRFAILGESFSGPVAIALAAKTPRIAGLILASSFACSPVPRIFAPFAQFLDLAWIPHFAAVAALLGPRAHPALSARLRAVLARLPKEVLRARAAAVFGCDARADLRRFDRPTLCLHGARDRLVSRACVAQTLECARLGEVAWLDAPHMALETRTSEACAEIERFCRRLDIGGVA